MQNLEKRLKKLLRDNNGVLSISIVMQNGIKKQSFYKFVKNLGLLKFSHGIYYSENYWFDKLYLLQVRYKSCIYSHETALYFHGLTDRDPLKYSCTFKSGYNYSQINKEDLYVRTAKDNFYELGVTEMQTQFDNIVRVYDKEKTICDIVKHRNTMDPQIYNDALIRYFRSDDKNLEQLWEYASLLGVLGILKRYSKVYSNV